MKMGDMMETNLRRRVTDFLSLMRTEWRLSHWKIQEAPERESGR